MLLPFSIILVTEVFSQPAALNAPFFQNSLSVNQEWDTYHPTPETGKGEFFNMIFPESINYQNHEGTHSKVSEKTGGQSSHVIKEVHRYLVQDFLKPLLSL